MKVINEAKGKNWHIYHADCIEVMQSMPDESIGLSIYSPPFCGLYNYSSSPRDLSNCSSYEEFFEHYSFVIRELFRMTKKGRITAVHCMDIPTQGANIGGYVDFPGDIIRAHQKAGWIYWTRRSIWKEPLAVRNRTMMKGLAHKQICDDATLTTVAGSDYLIEFWKPGENAEPVSHPTGLDRYCGEREIPHEFLTYRGMKGDQKLNRFSHFIWRNYASSFWDDIRMDHVLPYEESRDPDDEKHVHPLQLDVIERVVVLRSNPGDVVFTPFLGVGSEAYGAVINDRKAIGAELKCGYFNQAVKNLNAAKVESAQEDLFHGL